MRKAKKPSRPLREGYNLSWLEHQYTSIIKNREVLKFVEEHWPRVSTITLTTNNNGERAGQVSTVEYADLLRKRIETAERDLKQYGFKASA